MLELGLGLRVGLVAGLRVGQAYGDTFSLTCLNLMLSFCLTISEDVTTKK